MRCTIFTDSMAKNAPGGKKKGARAKKDLLRIERAAKRAEQKAAGALDGRFRTRMVESKKRYKRKRGPVDPDEGA